jgi:hypothetical protein
VMQGKFDVLRAWQMREDRSQFDEQQLIIAPELQVTPRR